MAQIKVLLAEDEKVCEHSGHAGIGQTGFLFPRGGEDRLQVQCLICGKTRTFTIREGLEISFGIELSPMRQRETLEPLPVTHSREFSKYDEVWLRRIGVRWEKAECEVREK